MIRGISKYTIETREILLASGAKVHTLVMPSIISRAPRTLQILLFRVLQQVSLPIYAVFKRPDVIFDAYNSYSLIAALRWRYVCVIHDFIPFSNKRWWTKPGSIYQRILHRLSPFIPKLEFNVLDILSICGMLPEPNVLTNKQKAKIKPSHFIFKPFSM